MQTQVAIGNMKFYAEQMTQGTMDAFGITRETFDKLTGRAMWAAPDRQRMSQALNSMIFGVSDLLGFERCEIPAEFTAAVISVVVAPGNCLVACHFMGNSPTAQDLGRGLGFQEMERVSAQQLFALVTQLVGDPYNSHAVVLFERNTGIKMKRTLELEELNKKGGK